MAIINCPECGNQVSDQAVSCPHCGCPIQIKDRYTITFSFQAIAGAQKFLNKVVSETVHQGMELIRQKGGKVINTEYGQITNQPLYTEQSAIIIYEAPKSLYKSKCVVTIKKYGWIPDTSFKWSD